MQDGNLMKKYLLLLTLIGAGCDGSKIESVRGTSQFLVRGIERVRTPTGWIVVYNSRAMCFVPDPDHKWEIK